MSDRHNIFAKITKATTQSDGTVIVEGIASSGTKDVQGEIVTPSAMKAALPDYMRFPALREMHDNWAAGKTVAARVDDGDGCTYIRAKVVDKDACQKVREGVYQGFSIGGHVPEGGRNKDDPTIIEAINLVEISLVDRPANPDAVIQLFKAKERPKMNPEKNAADAAAQKDAAAKALVEDSAKKDAAQKGSAGPGNAPNSQPKSKPGWGKDDMLQMANYLMQQAAACKDDDDVSAAAKDDGSGSDDNMTADDDVAAAAKDDDVSAAAKDDDVAEDDDVSAAAKDDGSGSDDNMTASAKPKTKKGDGVDTLTKAAIALAKVSAQNDELRKSVDTLRKQNAELRVRLEIKGALKRVPVAKSDDVDEPTSEVKGLERLSEIAKSGGSPNEIAVELAKMVHARGGTAGR